MKDRNFNPPKTFWVTWTFSMILFLAYLLIGVATSKPNPDFGGGNIG